MSGPPAAPEKSGKAGPGRLLVHAGLLLALGVFATTLTALYVGNERTYFFWDQAVYHSLAVRTALGFQQSFAEGMRIVRQSTLEDYNAYFALPLVPVLWVLGETRLAYELALALVYVVPFAATLGSIATALVRGPRALVFWTTAIVTILTPMVWVPEFRGYPDIGAALLVALAVRLALGDLTLRRPLTAIGTGALLAAAAIYRRPFLFAAPAFLAAAFLSAVLEDVAPVIREPRRAAARVLGAGARVVLTALGGTLFAFLIGRTVLLRLLANDFYGLYEAYLLSPGQVALSYLAPYGWLAVAGALLGYATGLGTGVLDRPRTAFVVAFGGFTFLEWTLVLRQVGEQYTLQFTPILLLGLVSFGWVLWTKSAGLLHGLIPHAAQLYLLANALLGLASVEVGYDDVVGRSLLAANWPPLSRWDYDRIILLVERLRKLAKPEDPILVVASSRVMNPDLLVSAERALYGWGNTRLNVINAPAIDSRDQYPLEALLHAQFVVRVDPLQAHVGPDKQRVVSVLHEMFVENKEMALDFEPEPGSIEILEDALVWVHRRQRPSSLATGLSTLRYIQKWVGRVPGSQPDWVVVSQRFPSWAVRRTDGTTTLTWHPALPTHEPKPVALYLRAPPEAAHVSGVFEFLDPRCGGASVVLSSLASDGSIQDLAEVTRRPKEVGAFDLAVATPPGRQLLLRLVPPPSEPKIDFCLLRVDALAVRP